MRSALVDKSERIQLAWWNSVPLSLSCAKTALRFGVKATTCIRIRMCHAGLRKLPCPRGAVRNNLEGRSTIMALPAVESPDTAFRGEGFGSPSRPGNMVQMSNYMTLCLNTWPTKRATSTGSALPALSTTLVLQRTLQFFTQLVDAANLSTPLFSSFTYVPSTRNRTSRVSTRLRQWTKYDRMLLDGSAIEAVIVVICSAAPPATTFLSISFIFSFLCGHWGIF